MQFVYVRQFVAVVTQHFVISELSSQRDVNFCVFVCIRITAKAVPLTFLICDDDVSSERWRNIQ
jgi:hypothetical protein